MALKEFVLVPAFAHPIAGARDNYRRATFSQAVEDRRSDGCVVGEGCSPVLVGAIRREDCACAFMPLGDDLKEQVGASPFDWQVSQFVADQDVGRDEAFQGGLQASGGGRGLKGVDHVDGQSEEDFEVPVAGLYS